MFDGLTWTAMTTMTTILLCTQPFTFFFLPQTFIHAMSVTQSTSTSYCLQQSSGIWSYFSGKSFCLKIVVDLERKVCRQLIQSWGKPLLDTKSSNERTNERWERSWKKTRCSSSFPTRRWEKMLPSRKDPLSVSSMIRSLKMHNNTLIHSYHNNNVSNISLNLLTKFVWNFRTWSSFVYLHNKLPDRKVHCIL